MDELYGDSIIFQSESDDSKLERHKFLQELVDIVMPGITLEEVLNSPEVRDSRQRIKEYYQKQDNKY